MTERVDISSDADETSADPAIGGVDFDILPTLLGYRLRRAQIRIVNSFAEHLKTLGLTPSQFAVLILINANPGLSQSALAELVGSNRSLMVRMIDNLEKLGLVDRKPVPTDRRSYALEITRGGASMVERLKQDVASHEATVSSGLTREEFDTLLALLGKIAD